LPAYGTARGKDSHTSAARRRTVTATEADQTEKKDREEWLKKVTPKLEEAVKQLRDARSDDAPSGDVGDKLAFELAVIAEEIGDVYVRLKTLAERVAVETTSQG
jgi:hypothetical protein